MICSNLLLEAAVNGRADGIVTFNLSDFRLAGERFGMDVLSGFSRAGVTTPAPNYSRRSNGNSWHSSVVEVSVDRRVARARVK